ncbi:MAG: antirepressor regulating drug resistance protein, partial [Eubacterium sp.]|nr:antirepressor regulating drug resistance protein [Eubacterium sp.]
MLENIFITVVNMSITASIAALVVIFLRAVSDKYLPRTFSYAIWVVVLLRLLVPFSFSSSVSLFNVIPVNNANISPDQNIGTISFIPSRAAVIDMPVENIPDTQLIKESSVDPYGDLGIKGAVNEKEREDFNTKDVIYFSIRVLWLAGMLLMLAYIAYSYAKTAQKFKTAVLVKDGELLEECKKVLGVNRKIQIFSSEVIDTPAVIGLIKPRIILPAHLVDPRFMNSANSSTADANATDSLSKADSYNEADAYNKADSFNENSFNKLDGYSFRKYIIIHELVHIKRLDYLIKPLSLLLLCIHWFNPVVWLSCRLLHKDMEMACDEKVIRVSKGDVRAEYASSLINMAARQNHSFGNGFLAFGESNIKSRVKGIMSYKRPAFWVGSIVVLFIAAASVLLLTNPLQSIETIADAGAANILS